MSFGVVVKVQESVVESEELEDSLEARVLAERVEEIISALSCVRDDLSNRVDDAAGTDAKEAESLEMLQPLVEQQADPQTYSSDDYRIEISSYTTPILEGYYQSADVQVSGQKAAYVADVQEHELLIEAQEVQDAAKQNQLFGYTDAQLDMDQRHVATMMKMRSVAEWYLMYDTNWKFN